MASILETFFILFSTDADKARAEIEGADASANKLAKDLDKAGKALPPDQVAKVAGELDHAAEAGAHLGAEVDKAGDHTKKAGEEAKRFGSGLADGAGKAREVGSVIGEWAGKLGFALGTLFSIEGIVESIKGAFERINRMTEEADRLGFGMNVEGLNAVSQVLEDAGGNVEKAQRQLRTFADSVSQAFGDADSKSAKALKSIHVRVSDSNGDLRDTEKVMLDLNVALQKLSAKKQTDILRDMGLKDPAIRELLTGKGLAEKFAEERAKGVITNAQAEQIRKAGLAWGDFKDQVAAFFNTLVGNWAPTLTRFFAAMEQGVLWLRSHQTLVQGFFIAIAAGLAVIAAVVWGTYIPAWAAAAVATIIALAPIVAITAAVLALAAAFALAYEDVKAFLRGDPSMLGEWVEKYEWVRNAVKGIGDAWNWLAREIPKAVDEIAGVVEWLFGQWWRVAGPIFSLLIDGVKEWAAITDTVLKFIWASVEQVFSQWWPYIEPVYKLITAGIQAVGQIFIAVAKAIWGEWGAMFDRFASGVQTVVGGVRGLMGLAEKGRQALAAATPGALPAAAAVGAGQGQLAAAGRNPLAAQTPGAVAARGGGTTNRTTQVHVGKVEVHTQATDADGMAKAAGGALTSEMRRATAQHADGVDR